MDPYGRSVTRFKRKGKDDSLRYPDPLQIKLDLLKKDPVGRGVLPRIFLPKVGWVKLRLDPIVPARNMVFFLKRRRL